MTRPVLALVQAWLLAGPPATDPPRPTSLVWEAPAECPDVEQLRARIDRFAPGVLERSELVTTSIEARVEASDGRFEATIHVENEAGTTERRLAATDCELVSDASALIIAVALAPIETVAAVQARPPIQKPSKPAEPAPAVSEAPAPEQQPEQPAPTIVLSTTPEPDDGPRSSLRVGLRAFGGAAYGPTNAAYGTIGGSLALFSKGWRAEVAGAWSIPRVVRRGELGGTFEGWTIAARGCWVPTARRLEFPLCPAVELGQVRGRGLEDLPLVQDASFLWVALGLGQGLWVAVHERFALGVDARVAVPLRGGAFTIDGREVQRLVPVSVTGLAGVEVRLP